MPPRFEFEFSYRNSPRITSVLRAPSTQRFLPAYVLLDTGADMSLFDTSLAEALSIDLTTADSLQVTGVGGAIADARAAPVEIELLGEPELRITLTVAFGPMAQLRLGNLVGLDVLEHFDFGLSHNHRLGYLGRPLP